MTGLLKRKVAGWSAEDTYVEAENNVSGIIVVYATICSASDVYKEVTYTSAQPMNQSLSLHKMNLLARCEITGSITANTRTVSWQNVWAIAPQLCPLVHGSRDSAVSLLS